MKKIGYFLTALIIAFYGVDLTAQNLNTPAPSPTGKIKQTVGVSNFSISYSRPGVKGRELFVEVESWDNIWRTGANAPTTIEFDGDATFEGQKVPAGKYSIFSIPGQEEWTWMLYSDLSIGGNTSAYDEKNEVARFTSKTETMDKSMERLTFNFADMTENSAKIEMLWGNYYTAFNVTVDTDAQVMAQIGEVMENPMASVGGLYAQAANYYYQNDKDLKVALDWMNKAIEINPNAFWNIHTKAQIQAKLGDKKGAIATAQKSLEKAKTNEAGDFGYIKRNEEAIAMWKK